MSAFDEAVLSEADSVLTAIASIWEEAIYQAWTDLHNSRTARLAMELDAAEPEP